MTLFKWFEIWRGGEGGDYLRFKTVLYLVFILIILTYRQMNGALEALNY